MKVIGSTTHIGVTMRDLRKIYTDDAVIPVSKKALKAYMMAAGIQEDIKPVSLQVVDNTENITTVTETEPEPLPPIEINTSDGDW
jgi:hypothetical protein